MQARRRTTVLLPAELYEKAKAWGLNLSAFLSIKLHEFFNNNNLALREGFEPSRGASPTGSQGGQINVSLQDVQRYFDYLQLNGLSKDWLNAIKSCIIHFLEKNDYCISESKVIAYLKQLQQKYDVTTYKKRLYQIRRFLRFINTPFANNLKAPKTRNKNNIRIWRCEDIRQAYGYLKQFGKRYTSALLLAATSGIRAEELYKLMPDDIDLQKCIVYIRKSKTGVARIAFFNEEAQSELKEYINLFINNKKMRLLFPKSDVVKKFKGSGLRVKDLRKFFSQEADRRGMPTSIKKLLMGHSINGDVDLMHYAAHNVEDLKAIYDKAGIKIFG